MPNIKINFPILLIRNEFYCNIYENDSFRFVGFNKFNVSSQLTCDLFIYLMRMKIVICKFMLRNATRATIKNYK